MVWTNDFTGLSDGCGATGSALVTFTATDECGNFAITTATFTIEDTTPPVIDPGASDMTVECDTAAGNVANLDAWLADNGGARATDACGAVVWTNDFTGLLDGCGATGSALVTFTATDECGNFAITTATFTIVDTTPPVIHDLRIDDRVIVDACCEATVTFTAYVTDLCGVSPAGITITVANLTNAVVEFDQARDVVFTQTTEGRVDIAGQILVRSLTSCPARVEVRIEATDRCGDVALPATSSETEGRVYDETAPVAMDDPYGDEDRSAGDDLKVRADRHGQYRLMVREDTPVRIDVLHNDDDNCPGSIRVYDIATLPAFGTATVAGGNIIRYTPDLGYTGLDQFTYRVVDACGNVSSEATVYIVVISQAMYITVISQTGDDLFLSICAGDSVTFELTAAYLWIDPDDPGEIRFRFTVVGGPDHGVLVGDLGEGVFARPHMIQDPTTGEPATTLSLIEVATITLTYTPAVGFVGQDLIRVRFADPFDDDASIVIIDILVSDCRVPGRGTIVVEQGVFLPLIIPPAFETVVETAWETVTLIAETDGAAHQGVLSVVWDPTLNRLILLVETGALPTGVYRLTIPLENGDPAIFMIEVVGKT